ncbi:hypothetical protein SALINJAH_104 [Bacillus phage SalinJah]|nr:hypothetical protein SALINJAH_104 [Bacillus phage SalinJah]ANH50571.1 hypothetical protein SALINJAH_104 [Bacillus phage SalinJah]
MTTLQKYYEVSYDYNARKSTIKTV